MEKLTFLIDSLNRAAERYHLTNGDPDMKVRFLQETTVTTSSPSEMETMTTPSPSEMEVVLNVWAEYNYHGLTVRKVIIRSATMVRGYLRSKKLRDKRPVRSINDYHAHEDLIARCCDELVSAMVLMTGDWSFRKIITGDAVINPFAKSPEPYYGMTFKDIIRHEFGSIYKEKHGTEKI